ncbi:hypothetical protein BJY04DRAFT_213217 [Aspergillus karnatakaensis]|uniref:phytanoyl-CoA dioxygenase family protein n=1 Tax=Aspergillus karnatakaensis TaxID=1810916 RepID=UPI003CCCDD8B
MAGPLSEAQVELFRTNGYLILRNSEHRLATPTDLQKWTDEVRTWPLEKGKWMPYNETNADGNPQLMRTEYFVDFHRLFHSLLYGRKLGDILAQLSGSEMRLFKDKINYKSPRASGFKPHIDAPGYDHIGNIEHLTANFAVDPATIENGCLEVVAGSHRAEFDLVQGAELSAAWEAAHEWTPVLLDAGDLLIFGSHLAHRSAPNLSTRPRASIYATYHGSEDGADLREKYYAHRRVAFPPDHEREDGKDYEEGRKRYGSAAHFAVPKVSQSIASVAI